MESLSNSNGSQFSSYNSLEQATINSYLNNMLQFDGNFTDVDDEMASKEKRFETFKGWPESSPLKPMDLANAGFYYTGSGDEVRCFSCDLQLKEWKLGDDPFDEHRRRKCDCNFVLEKERERLGITCNPETVSYEPTTGSVGNRLEDYTRNPYIAYSNQYKYEMPPFSNQSVIRHPSYQLSGYPGFGDMQQQQQQPRFPAYQESLHYQLTNNQRSSHVTSSPGVFVTSQYPHSNHPVLQTPGQFTVRPSVGVEQSSLRPSNMRMPSLDYPGMHREVPTGYQESMPRPFDRYPVRNVDIPVLSPVLQHVPTVHVRTEDTHHTASQTDLQNNHHRLTTFIDWPEDCPVHPWELASAGFFYMGTGDNVKCYKCKVMLRNWEPDDTPWEEHKRWSPECPLVKEHEEHASTPVEDQEQATETSSYQRFPPTAPNVPVIQRQEQYKGTYIQPENHQQQEYPARNSKILAAQSEKQPHYGGWGKAASQFDPLYCPSTENTAFTSSVQTTAITRSSNVSSFNPVHVTASSTTQGCNSESLNDSDFTRVIEMGFSRADIDNAIARQTERTGTGFAKLDDLMQVLLDDSRTSTTSSPPLTGQSTNLSESNPEMTETQTMSSPTEAPRAQLSNAQSFSFEQSNISAKRALKRSNSAPPGASTSNPSEQLATRDLDKMQEERLICKICMDAEVGVVFIPCGHISCCPHCASGLDLCPMCRKPIRQVVRTFLS